METERDRALSKVTLKVLARWGRGEGGGGAELSTGLSEVKVGALTPPVSTASP